MIGSLPRAQAAAAIDRVKLDILYAFPRPLACSMPRSVSLDSLWPWTRRSSFQLV